MALEKYRFTLSGIVVPVELERTPEGWKDIEITAERQEDIDGIVVIFTSEVVFVEDGYTILKELFDNNYNDQVDVDIETLQGDSYITSFEGAIILTDIEFNLDVKEAKTSIQDRSFFAKINNNKNIKADLAGDFSKNQVKIGAPTPILMDFFRTNNGNFTGALANRTVFQVKEVFDYLVRFMTDNEVKGVQSDYLVNPTNFEGGIPFVVIGEEIRLATGLTPNISFKDLYKTFRNTHNISFDIVKNSNGDPVMRIEEKEFFFEQEESLTIRNIKDLTLTADKNRIFSHLEIGNNTFAEGSFPFSIRFFVFRDEDYVIKGRGNVDRVLDLKIDFITDSNVIEDITLSNDDSFDDDIIIVTGTSSGALAFIYGSAAPFNYNNVFTNDKIILKFINGIPNSIAKYLGQETTPFRAEKSTDQIEQDAEIGDTVIAARVAFNNDSVIPAYDNGNNYDTGLFFYDVPFAETYVFNSSLQYEFRSSTPFARFDVQEFLIMQRWTSGFVTLLEEKGVNTPFFLYDRGANVLKLKRTITSTRSFVCNTGDRIVIKAFVIVKPLISLGSGQPLIANDLKARILKENSFFESGGAGDDGPVYKIFDPLEYRALLYTFEKNVNLADRNTINNNLTKRIIINETDDPANDRTAWVNRVSSKIETSETTFNLIT